MPRYGEDVICCTWRKRARPNANMAAMAVGRAVLSGLNPAALLKAGSLEYAMLIAASGLDKARLEHAVTVRRERGRERVTSLQHR